MSPKIIKVSTTENFEIIITYEGNLVRIFDVKPLLQKGIFSELKDIEQFKKIKISFDTVEWSNGMDIDPDDLYQYSVEMKDKNIA